MVRYTIGIAEDAGGSGAKMRIEEKVVNIFHNEQPEEQFLRDVNPKGQVCIP